MEDLTLQKKRFVNMKTQQEPIKQEIKKKKTENQCVWEKFIKCKEVYPWDIPMGKGKKDIWRNNSWKITKSDENYKPLDASSSMKYEGKEDEEEEEEREEEEGEEDEEEEENYTKWHNNKIFQN